MSLNEDYQKNLIEHSFLAILFIIWNKDLFAHSLRLPTAESIYHNLLSFHKQWAEKASDVCLTCYMGGC